MLTRRVAAALASSRGLFLCAVISGSLCGVAFLGIGGDQGRTVTACFSDADGLVNGNEVRVAGVPAGSVTSVTVGSDQQLCQMNAEVQFQVDSQFWPLHQGTTVAIKPKGVLSNVFLQLTPGPVHNPSLGGSPFFSASQTQSPVNLDELSNVFTPDVRESIRTQLQEGVLAFSGAGAADLNQTLYYANPLTADAVPVTDVLATRSPQLDSLNYEFDAITGDLARENANLQPLIVNLNTFLGALAAKEVQLQGTLVHAAGVLTTLDDALSSPQTQAALQDIFAIGPEALSCTQALSQYLTPLVTQVNPHIRSLDTLLDEFVTATGYNSDSDGIDSLRINPTTQPNGYSATESGGLGAEHSPGYEESLPLGYPATLGNGCALPPGVSP